MNRGIDLETHEPVASYERRWTLFYAALLMLVTTIPYLLGYLRQGDEWRFTGFVFGVEDGNSYIAKMLSGSAGAWLFKTPYTAFPQRGALIFLPYILLGKLVSPLGIHEQLVALYHLFRVVGGVVAVMATYELISFYIHDVKVRRFALILATVGGGLGWILVLLGKSDWLGSLPLEYYSPETFGFLGLYGIAHLAMARGLLLLSLVAYLKASIKHPPVSKRAAGGIGVLWLLTGLVQPLTGMVVGAFVGFYLATLSIVNLKSILVSHRPTYHSLINLYRIASMAAILPLPLVLYNLLQFNQDPFLATWTLQSYIPSPHPLHYLLAFGLLLPFAIQGGRRLLRQYPWTGWLPVAWVLALPVLAYAPFSLQRRLPEGIWVVLVILALKYLDINVSNRSKSVSTRHLAGGLVLSLAFPSTLFLFAGGILTAGNTSIPVFRPADEIAVFQYLGERAKLGEIVLSHYQTGNVLPAWAPVRVVIGHGPESAGIEELSPQVAEFYRPDTEDEWRKQFIRRLGVDYVFWGPAERELGGWDPTDASFLELLFHKGDYAVFSVKE